MSFWYSVQYQERTIKMLTTRESVYVIIALTVLLHVCKSAPVALSAPRSGPRRTDKKILSANDKDNTDGLAKNAEGDTENRPDTSGRTMCVQWNLLDRRCVKYDVVHLKPAEPETKAIDQLMCAQKDPATNKCARFIRIKVSVDNTGQQEKGQTRLTKCAKWNPIDRRCAEYENTTKIDAAPIKSIDQLLCAQRDLLRRTCARFVRVKVSVEQAEQLLQKVIPPKKCAKWNPIDRRCADYEKHM